VEGAKWSPYNFKLAAVKVDNRKVHRLPIVHWLKPQEEVEWVPFTKVGGPMPQVEIFVIDILSRKQIRVDIGNKPDQLLRIIGWLPDSSELLFTRMSRDFKVLDLIAANSNDGSTRVILTETQKTFIDPPYLSGSGFSLFEDGKRFIWISERDGWAHLYLYDINGNLIRRLTTGTFPVMKVVTMDEKRSWVYFTAHADTRLYDTHLYRVDFEGKRFKRLTEGTGQHNVAPNILRLFGALEGNQFSPSKEFFLDTHSSVDRPPVVELRKADGTLLQTLTQANIDALKDLKWSPPEEFVIKAADGQTDLYGVLYKPYDFDPNKKYPVIDHIYNGPQTTWVPRTFINSRGIRAQALAQLGYIVFLVDGRGTPERGKEFQDVVYRNIGRNEILDHVATLHQLAEKRPYMDLNRVGVFGGSWGGYMVFRALVLAPDVYHVGISTTPGVEFAYMGNGAVEPWMDLPEHNKEGYEYGSSLWLADKLKSKLLLLCGTSDVNVNFGETMLLVEGLVRAGKPFDLIVFPDQTHWFTGASNKYWMDAIRRYFQEYLKP